MLPGPPHGIVTFFRYCFRFQKDFQRGETQTPAYPGGKVSNPKNFGTTTVRLREGKKVQELHEELVRLMGQWEDIYKQLKTTTPPAKLLSELDKPASVLRDMLSDGFSRIVVNEKDLYTDIRAYMQNISPDQVGIVQLHTLETGVRCFQRNQTDQSLFW